MNEKPEALRLADECDWSAKFKAAKELRRLHAKIKQLQSLLSRIRQWDHLDTAADGAFWKHEIDAALRREDKR